MTLRGIGARKTRSILTALSVFFGVAMIAGTLMLTDSVNSSFDEASEPPADVSDRATAARGE